MVPIRRARVEHSDWEFARKYQGVGTCKRRRSMRVLKTHTQVFFTDSTALSSTLGGSSATESSSAAHGSNVAVHPVSPDNPLRNTAADQKETMQEILQNFRHCRQEAHFSGWTTFGVTGYPCDDEQNTLLRKSICADPTLHADCAKTYCLQV